MTNPLGAWPAVRIPHGSTISIAHLESIGQYLGSIGLTWSSSASAVWPVANTAYFIPFRLSEPVTVTLLWWLNGTAVAGNVDCGLYDAAGTRIVSAGSTAQAGTSAIQSVNITDTLIGPGTFFMALALDDATTATIRRFAPGNASFLKACGCAEQATAFALPATATFATYGPNFLPIFGMTLAPITVV